jgi:hypothetical protein
MVWYGKREIAVAEKKKKERRKELKWQERKKQAHTHSVSKGRQKSRVGG